MPIRSLSFAALRARWVGIFWVGTQGSPRGLGQPWAGFFDTVGVVGTNTGLVMVRVKMLRIHQSILLLSYC